MKLFVTGICGRLGRAIAQEAAAQAIEVVGLDRNPWPAEMPLPDGVRIEKGSFEDIRLVETLMKGCDGMINTAGPHGEDLQKLDLAAFLRGNVEVVARILEAAVAQGLRRVALSSSMEVLIGRGWDTSGATIVDEASPPQTDSPYSLSRLLQEHLGREFARRNDLSVASLRYMAFGYGPDDDLGPRLLARTVAARDAARAAILAASSNRFIGEVFNIGPQTPLTYSDIIAAISDPEKVLESHFPGAVKVLHDRNVELNANYFWPVTRIQKAQRLLNWQPQVTFESWLQQQGWRGSTT